MNYKKSWLQFILGNTILCQENNNKTVFIKMRYKDTEIVLEKRDLFWYCDFLGGWEKLSWKLKNASYFPNHDMVNSNPEQRNEHYYHIIGCLR